ncbi:A24 family peptidase [Plantactinospora sp. KLBMP9567]|uniref:prepilin peptidase n=1 Tax=Plantactinospora sp. KLBMP9567 TaxID=3085900 RepID=UPI0029817D71|nr:A24 family peptidase [Plantactinospora sp. KLBMP9567]MDW5327895.1 A24 family peptidase [Plantactinospora sp. KLBMP9567]
MDDDDLTASVPGIPGGRAGAAGPPPRRDPAAARSVGAHSPDQGRSEDCDHGVTLRTQSRSGSRWPAQGLALLCVAPALRWLVAAESVPYGQPRRSGCDHCGTPIGLAGPLRPLTPSARCAGCGGRVGAAPLAVETALLLAVVAVVAAARSPIESIAFGWWAACAVPLLFVDVAVHRLPDRLSYAAAAGTLGLLGAAALVAGDPSAWWRAVLAGLGAALFLAGTTLLLGRRGFGLGDAKLALSAVAVLGWLGWPAVVLGALLTFGASALCGLALLATRRIGWGGHLPFGPFLVLGTLSTLALS